MNISNYSDMIYACGRCEFCRGYDFDERCPEIYAQRWESATARGRMAIARAILEGKLEYSKGLAERIFGCFMCGRCKFECEKAAKIDIVGITKAMRADFVEQGIDIPEAGENMAVMAYETGNIFGDTAKTHTRWADGLDFTTASETLFYPGCLASHRFKEKTNILVRVLQAAGYQLDFLGDEQKCCGTPYWISGKMSNAKKWAADFLDELKMRGTKTIITPCPSCFRAFYEIYPEILGLDEFPIEVKHTSQVLRNIIQDNKLALNHHITHIVTYHDPCEIGRYHNIYEPPRDVIRAIPGIDFREMIRNRHEAFCCGAGGGVKVMYEDNSQKVARRRLEDIKTVQATIIATVCPACEMNLTHAVYEADAPMRVVDLAELLAVSAGIVDEEILDPFYIPND